MDEDFKDVTANSKHIAIIFFLVILVLLIGGYLLVFKPIYFSVKTIEVELGSELPTNIEDYMGSYGGLLSNYSLDTSEVKVDTIGEYEYNITNGKFTKKGKIKVVDTTPPEFTLQDLTIEEGSTDYYLGEFLASCEDSSKPCLVSLKDTKDESKFSTPGTYTIEIEVSDVYNNKKSAKANLIVAKKGEYTDPRSLDLEYASSSKKDGEFDGLIFKKLERAINPQSDTARDEMSRISTVDLQTYVQENYPGYRIVSSEIIELYNKSNFIIGYAILLDITNGQEKIVYVDSAKAQIPSAAPNADDQTATKDEEE